MRRITTLIFLIAILLLLIQSPAQAFKPDIHAEITREVLSSISLNVNNETLQFSNQAIQQIITANEQTDSIAYQTQSYMHFDGEDFWGGSRRLVNLKERVIKKITDDNPLGSSARADLGGALHTLQDFYAHSNWVELGNSNINLKLGREIFLGVDKNVVTCPNDPSILGSEGLKQLTSGYFLFSGVRTPLCDVPQGKCRHGVPLICSEGLNKDDSSRASFSTARTLAVEASKDFLNQILEDSHIASNAEVVKALLGQT